MSLPRINPRNNRANVSKGVSDVLTNWGAAPAQNDPRRLRRGPSLEDLNQREPLNPNDSEDNLPTQITESPKQSLTMKPQGGFRDEFGLNEKGPMRAMRPSSNQQNAYNPMADIQLPPSMSQEKNMRFKAGIDGKALLHDLDNKFDTQDKMINFLMNQIQSLEQNLTTQQRKIQSIQEGERAERFKIENQLKLAQDQSTYDVRDLIQKINFFEEALQREEKARLEVKEKLRVHEDSSRDVINFIKSIQNQGDQELTQIRSFIQEKLNGDHLNTVKQKEKSTVLFNEVVRLGEEYEKQIEFLQGLNQNFENRIQTLEARLASSEQNQVSSEKKVDITQTMLNDIIEKIEGKLLNVEQNVHFMKADQKKEKENLSRLEISSLRYNEDFKQILSSVQSEFQGRLEIKMTDLVNRLLLEQEERLRSLDDLKYQIDMKEKMNSEKSKHEREEMRDRYAAMDSIVRAEFQRKDEAILALQNSLETQIRTINGWVKQEELARTQQEINLRGEIAKVADSIRYDMDGFKGQQVQVTEKLSEMIKMEVDSRLSSDKETKVLIQSLIKNVMSEVAGVKEIHDKQLQKLTKDVKDTAHDSAERAHFLSRYIDEEIIKIGQKVTKQIDNIKTLCAKLTEQFKKHLINHENMKKDIYKRFEIIESHLPMYRSELYKLMEQSEGRVLGKMKEVKDAIEQTMLTNFQVLDERVDQFSELVDSNMETLRKAVQDNREVFVSVINKTNEELETRINSQVEDLEKIATEVYELSSRMDEGGGQSKQDSSKIIKMINDLEAHINTSIITEKSVRKAQDKQLAEELDKMGKNLFQIAKQIQEQLELDEATQKANKQGLEGMLNKHKEDIEKLSTDFSQLSDEYKSFKYEASQNILDAATKIEIESMTAKIESSDAYNKLQDVLQVVQELNDKLNDPDFQLSLKKDDKAEKPVDENMGEKLEEKVDLKIEAAFEKLRNDNMYIWKQSIELAEQEFNKKGVSETMNFLPKLLLDKADLKRTINTLIIEDEEKPKPIVLPDHLQVPKSKILEKGEEEPVEEQKDEDQEQFYKDDLEESKEEQQAKPTIESPQKQQPTPKKTPSKVPSVRESQNKVPTAKESSKKAEAELLPPAQKKPEVDKSKLPVEKRPSNK